MTDLGVISNIQSKLKEHREKGKQAKEERKTIDNEASKAADQEYLESYREERMNVAKSKARAKGKRDASERKSSLRSVAGIGKAGFNMFANAGKNLIESGQLDMPTGNVDLGFGMSKKTDKKSKKKKKAKTSIFDIL